jgi:hypothetical protein
MNERAPLRADLQACLGAYRRSPRRCRAPKLRLRLFRGRAGSEALRGCRIYLRHCQAEELRKEFGSTGSRLIVNNMARGAYLIGSKREERVRAVQIVDCAGNSTTLRLKDYISRKIEPEYKTLPWQQDVAVLLSANEKAEKVR